MKVKRLLALIALSLIGIFGINQILKFSQFYATQRQALGQSATLITEDGQGKTFASLDDLKGKQKQLQKTISTLNETPHLPGFDYDKAQTNLTKLRTLDSTISQRIQIEEGAVTTLETARKIHQEAGEIVQKQPNVLEDWQASKSKWQEVISLLEKIPADTYVTAQAQETLNAARAEYKIVSQNVEIEEKAIGRIDSAMEIAERAASLTGDYPYEMPTLMNARTHWVRSIRELTSVFGSAATANDAATFLQYYQQNLERVDAAISELKACLDGNAGAISLCRYNVSSIQIEMPPTEVALDSDEESDSSETTDELPEFTASSNVTPVVIGSRYRRYRSSIAASSSSGSTFVRGYTRSDGTRVRSYSRSSSRSGGFGSFRSGGSSS